MKSAIFFADNHVSHRMICNELLKINGCVSILGFYFSLPVFHFPSIPTSFSQLYVHVIPSLLGSIWYQIKFLLCFFFVVLFLFEKYLYLSLSHSWMLAPVSFLEIYDWVSHFIITPLSIHARRDRVRCCASMGMCFFASQVATECVASVRWQTVKFRTRLCPKSLRPSLLPVPCWSSMSSICWFIWKRENIDFCFLWIQNTLSVFYSQVRS